MKGHQGQQQRWVQSIRNGKKRGYKVERVKVRLLKDNEWISMGNRNLCWCQFRMLLKGEPCLMKNYILGDIDMATRVQTPITLVVRTVT